LQLYTAGSMPVGGQGETAMKIIMELLENIKFKEI